MTATDLDLLRRFARDHAQDDFAELVRRHLNLVYSAALRQVRSPQLAEEIAQSVFADLARDTAKLASADAFLERPLSGWLFTVTRRTAIDAIRKESRRQLREQIAVEINHMNVTENDWTQIEPLLDDAMAALDETERSAILLRYFENKSLREVGEQLNISDDAAQKRVSRAVERLREFFTKQKITIGVGGLAALISANAVQSAPAALIATISAAALAGTAVSTSTAIAVTKTIAMTTLQKITVTAALTAAVGAGLYQAKQTHDARAEVRTLQQELALMQQAKPAEPQVEPQANHELAPPAAVIPTSQHQTDWTLELLALNTSNWRQAFAVGQKLAALPPEIGLAALRSNWNSITNDTARQQLLKAFQFAAHERLPAVLEMGLNDQSPEVQSWALNYLKEVALRDFSSDYSGAKAWLANHRDSTLATGLSDAVVEAAANMPHLSGDSLLAQLQLLHDCNIFLAKYPEAIASSGLPDLLGNLARGNDPRAAVQALNAASGLPLGDAWLRDVALPLLKTANTWEVTEAAAGVLSRSGSEWALKPLLDTLTESVYSTNHHLGFSLTTDIAAIKSPKAIPMMIALIEAENTYDTVYGIGYFGLGKLTGVEYNPEHDGTWWRQWWTNNKQRFPADVQVMEIPKLNPVPTVQQPGKRNNPD